MFFKGDQFHKRRADLWGVEVDLEILLYGCTVAHFLYYHCWLSRYAEPEGRLPFGWLYKTYSHRIEGVGNYPESLIVCYFPSPGWHGRDVPALPQWQHREVEGQAQEGVRAAWRVGVWPQVPFKALNLYDWYWSQIPFIVLNICTIEIGNYVFNRKLLEFKPDEFKGPDDGKTLEVFESL